MADFPTPPLFDASGDLLEFVNETYPTKTRGINQSIMSLLTYDENAYGDKVQSRY